MPRHLPMPTQVRVRKIAKSLASGSTVKDAMIAAGYSEKTASHATADVLAKVRAELAIELDKIVNREELIQNLVNIATGAKTTERMMHQATGNVQEFTDDDNYARVKATELLGKFLGALSSRKEITVEGNIKLAEEIQAARARVENAKNLEQPSVDAQVIRELPAKHEQESQ